MPNFWSAMGAVASTVGVLIVIGTLIWRYVIMPNLRAQLVEPVARVEHQVSRNGGVSAPPTLPDKVAVVDVKTDLILAELREVNKRLGAGDARMSDLDAGLADLRARMTLVEARLP